MQLENPPCFVVYICTSYMLKTKTAITNSIPHITDETHLYDWQWLLARRRGRQQYTTTIWNQGYMFWVACAYSSWRYV